MKARLFTKTVVTLFFIATLIMTFIVPPVLANIDFVDGSENYLSTKDTGKDVSSGSSKLGTPNFGATDLDYPKSETLTGEKVETNPTVGDENKLNSTNEWSEFIGDNKGSTQLVIGINSGILDAYTRLMDIIAKHDCEVVNTVSMAGEIIAVVVNFSSTEMSSFVNETRADGLSRYIEPRMKVQAQLVPNDPYWSLQWGPQKIEADWAWNTTIGDPSVLVAVIDTGIDWDHPDLAANYVALGYDWVNNDMDPMDDEGHGTHCAGIIAAVINNSIGVAGLAQVQIMAEKGLDQYGEGYEDDLANAIIHAVDQGADILSNSWGSYGESALIHDAVKYAYDSGVLVVAAAGNDATSNKLFPAAFDEVIAISATDEYDNPAWFTNFGEWVELAAPGVNIYSTVWNDFYDYKSGTSMSTPHVAGVAALILSRFPNMTRDWVQTQLRYTADDLGDPGFDDYYGHGRINARKAVEQALSDHDLLIFDWKRPQYVKPGDLVTFNVTVLNFGANDESNITVQLLVDSNITDLVSISFLASGTSTTVSVSWNPTVEGIYNVTFYVVPVPGETLIENNVVAEMIEVRYPIGYVLFDQTHGTDIIAYYSIWVANLTDRGYIVDTLITSPITSSVLEGYDVFVIPQAYYYYSADELSAIQGFVLDGGGLLVIGDDEPYIYTELTGFAGISWMSGGVSGITTDITPHEVTEGVTSVYLDAPVAEMLMTAMALDLVRDPAGGIMLAVSEQVGRVIGFADEGSLWDYGIGYEDNLRLANNMIDWLVGVKYQHELAVRLDAPNFLEPGDSSLLNATVYNRGLNNETDVELFLLINGSAVNNVTIPELVNSTSYTIGYLWTPTVEATYNITAYAVPVPGENITVNNWNMKLVRVGYAVVIGVIVTHGETLHTEELANYYASLGHIVEKITTTITPGVLSNYDIIIVGEDWGDTPWLSSEIAAVEAFIDSGRGFVAIGDELATSVQEILGTYGISYTGISAPGGSSSHFDPLHPIMQGVSLIYAGAPIDSLQITAPAYWIANDISDTYILIASAEVGGYVLCLSNDFAYYLYNDDNEVMFKNIVDWMTTKYEHELVVRLDAPDFLEPSDSSLLNATVYNHGLSNETGVELFLLINGSIVDSVVIPELLTGSSYTLSYMWTPTVEATYNVTAYVPPVIGESFIINNVASVNITVSYVIAYVAVLNAVEIPSYWDGGWNNDYQTLVDALIANGFYAQAINNEEIIAGILVNFDVFVMVDNAPNDAAVPYIIDFWLNGGGIVAFDSSICFLCYAGILPPESAGSNGYYVYWDYNTGSTAKVSTAHPVTAGYTVGQLISGQAGDAEYLISALAGTVAYPYYTKLAEDVSISDHAYVSAYEPPSGGKVVHIWDQWHWSNNGLQLMILNAMKWTTPTKYEHELVVSLEAPTSLEPGDSSLLNATVYNRGLSNETSVDLFLLINGTAFNSTTIPELLTGASYTINYLWTPTVEAIYNITAYASPVPDENVTANNLATKIVTVRFAKYVLWDDVHDGDDDSLTGNYLLLYQLLSSSGFVVHELTSGTINSGVLAPYDILVLIDPEYDFLSSEISDIHDWVEAGGALIVIPNAGYPSTLNTIMAPYGVQLTGLSTGSGTTTNVIAHPITQDVGSIYYTLAWKLAVSSPSETLAWTLEYYAFLSATTGGEVVVISDSNIMDNERLGMADNTQLMLNVFNWIGVKYEHDLAVTLEAPTLLEPSDSSLLNATVSNRGLSNETNVELFLLINGTMVDNATIPELLTGSSYTLSYLWTPTIEATYNMTVYAPPVLGENVTVNNRVTRLVHARYITVALISDDSELLAITPILNSMGIGYDIYNDNSIYLYTEDLDLLLSYQTVIFYTDYRHITSNEYTALESYLSSGGSLLVTGFDSLVSDDLLRDIIRSATMGDNMGELDLFVVDASHPIMNGPYGSFPAGYYISGLYSDNDAVEADIARMAVTVAELADGYDKIIATEGLLGKVVYWNGRGDNDWTTNVDCEAMFKNALIWFSQPRYTLTVYSVPSGVTFTADGVSHTTPWSETYDEGTLVSLVMPKTHDGYVWSYWLEDGDTNRIKTVTIDTNMTLTGVFTVPQGGKATPINMATIKPELRIPWTWLTTIILAISMSVAYIKYRKKQ